MKNTNRDKQNNNAVFYPRGGNVQMPSDGGMICGRWLYPGMRFTHTAFAGAELAELLNCEDFSGMEIGFTQLESLSIFQRNEFTEKILFPSVGEIFSRSLKDTVFFSTEKLIHAFTEETISVCRKLGAMKIKNIVLDLPVAEILVSGGKEKEFLKRFYRQLLPVLMQFDQYILLPLRIPARENCMDTAGVSMFLRECMNPRIKFLLDIHPHELDRETSVEEYALQTAFDAKSIVFHYSRDKGEVLVKAHLTPWVEYLVRHGFNGSFLASPDGREIFSGEDCTHFAELLHEISRKQKIQ